MTLNQRVYSAPKYDTILKGCASKLSTPIHLPISLQEAPLWTLSGVDKMPLNLQVFQNSSKRVGFSYKSAELLPLAEVLDIKAKAHDDSLLPTLRINAENQYTVCDIEPTSDFEQNPWMKLPFIYLEKSRNGGFHGLLPLRYNKDLALHVVLKDNIHHTEFILDRHFITITLDEISMPASNLAMSLAPAFQINLAKRLSKLINTRKSKSSIHVNSRSSKLHSLLNQPLNKHNQAIILNTNIEPLHFKPTDDKSAREARYVAKIVHILLRADPNLSLLANRLQLLTMTNILAKTLMPKRDKHNRFSNYQDVGHASYIDRLIFNAVDFVIHQSSQNLASNKE